jgi:CHASE1-domain containing sensor protein
MGHAVIKTAPDIGAADGSRLHRPWRGDFRPVRPLRRPVEARLSMLVAGLYIAATVAVTVYMLVALLRPEDF